MSDTPPEETLVEVFLQSVVTRRTSQQQLIKLKEKGGSRAFPIVIGLPEAAEIRRVVKGQNTERPMTHELLVNTVEVLGAKITSVDVVDLRHHTFFARIVLQREGSEEPIHVDARPSDAIALAMRAGAPLRVAESVLAEVRTDEGQDPLESEPESESDSEEDGDEGDDADETEPGAGDD